MALISVTLDLDGTLLDTVPDLAAACHAMLIELGQPPRSDAEIRRFVGKGMAVLVERCLTWQAAPAAALLEVGIASFRRHYAEVNGHSTQLYPGVLAGLRAFQDQGFKLGVVTNKPEAFTMPLLERQGLADYFAVVVSGDTLPVKKPDPAPVRHACTLLGVTTAQNVHIGDSTNDFIAARTAGCLTVGVPYGYNEGQAVTCSPVDVASCHALVSDLHEAAGVVAAWNNEIRAGATLSALAASPN